MAHPPGHQSSTARVCHAASEADPGRDRMSRRILFYVSGHGFGHARRMTQLIVALRHTAADVAVHVRTAAPAKVFEPLDPCFIHPSTIDAGMVESNALAIDPPATLEHLVHFMQRRES